jgi:hypothetical protein
MYLCRYALQAHIGTDTANYNPAPPHLRQSSANGLPSASGIVSNQIRQLLLSVSAVDHFCG